MATGTGPWEVCATGADYNLGSGGPPVSGSATSINSLIATCNVNAGSPTTSSVGWVGAYGGSNGNLAVGQANGTGAPDYSTIACINPAARWMWFNDSPSSVNNPFKPGANRKEYLIFRLPAQWLLWAFGASGSCHLIGNNFNASTFDMDPQTGAATGLRGGTPFGLAGLSFSPFDARLYGVTANLSGNSALYTIDPVSGRSDLIGQTGLPQLLEGDLAFDPQTGKLFGMYDFGIGLFTIDPKTGHATDVGSLLPDFLDPSAMAFNAAGELYVFDQTQQILAKVDKTTGQKISIVPVTPSFSPATVSGMTFDRQSGKLFLAAGANSSRALYVLNPATGSTTLVGPTGTDVSALACVPNSLLAPLAVPATAVPALSLPTSIILVILFALVGLIVIRRSAVFRASAL